MPCHFRRSKLYDDVPVGVITPTGATSLSIEVIRDGIVGRGVLLDIPRLRGQPWLEPGDSVTIEDLRAAEEAQNLHVGKGDLLFVRVGHSAWERSSEPGTWRTHGPACISTALEFVAEPGSPRGQRR